MSNFTPAWFKKGFFNESLFCDDFLSTHQLLYSNGAFFTPDGRMVDPMPLRCEIFEMMREYVGANLAKKVTNVVMCEIQGAQEDFARRWERCFSDYPDLLTDAENKEQVQKCSPAWNDSALCDGTEMIPSTEQKCSTNQRNKNNLKDNHLIKTTDAYLTFGEYRNVFLTEKEYKRLKADFSGLDGLIDQLSDYIQSTGRKYADHAATLRIWAKRQKSEQKQAPGIPDYTFREGESL